MSFKNRWSLSNYVIESLEKHQSLCHYVIESLGKHQSFPWIKLKVKR